MAGPPYRPWAMSALTPHASMNTNHRPGYRQNTLKYTYNPAQQGISEGISALQRRAARPQRAVSTRVSRLQRSRRYRLIVHVRRIYSKLPTPVGTKDMHGRYFLRPRNTAPPPRARAQIPETTVLLRFPSYITNQSELAPVKKTGHSSCMG